MDTLTEKVMNMKKMAKKIRRFSEHCPVCAWHKEMGEQGHVEKRCPKCGNITQLQEIKPIQLPTR